MLELFWPGVRPAYQFQPVPSVWSHICHSVNSGDVQSGLGMYGSNSCCICGLQYGKWFSMVMK